MPLVTATQQLRVDVPATTNTQATIKELLNESFSARSVSYKRNAGDRFFQELLVNSTNGLHGILAT
jgi:hypothetical protein